MYSSHIHTSTNSISPDPRLAWRRPTGDGGGHVFRTQRHPVSRLEYTTVHTASTHSAAAAVANPALAYQTLQGGQISSPARVRAVSNRQHLPSIPSSPTSPNPGAAIAKQPTRPDVPPARTPSFPADKPARPPDQGRGARVGYIAGARSVHVGGRPPHVHAGVGFAAALRRLKVHFACGGRRGASVTVPPAAGDQWVTAPVREERLLFVM